MKLPNLKLRYKLPLLFIFSSVPLILANNLFWFIIFDGFNFPEFVFAKTSVWLTIIVIINISIIVVIFISLWASNLISRPIVDLTNEAKNISDGRLDYNIDIKTGDELEDLGRAFNTMAANLKSAFSNLEDQKDRTEKAAKLVISRDMELRTTNDQLEDDIKKIEDQKKRSEKSAELLLRRDLDLRQVNDELEIERNSITAERNILSVVLSGIKDAVISVDMERRILTFNSVAEQLTGYLEKDVIGKPVNQIIKLNDKSEELSETEYCPIRSDSDESFVFKKEHLKLTGKEDKNVSFINLTVGHIKEGKKVNLGCIMTMHDITNEQSLEEMRLDFVSMAAHELRTPLTTIKGYLEVFVNENKDKLGVEQNMFLSRINIASSQLSALIENLLSVSKIERGVYTINIEKADWISLIKLSLEGFKEQAKEKHINLNFVEPEKQISQVLVDKLRISEVLTNLISNAISYTYQGGWIRVWIEEHDNEVITHIQDNGEGIPKEAIPHLFTKFFRVSGKLAQGSKGTGLGLYISKAIIELHHGRIWAESDLGNGSEFSFALPIEKDN